MNWKHFYLLGKLFYNDGRKNEGEFRGGRRQGQYMKGLCLVFNNDSVFWDSYC